MVVAEEAEAAVAEVVAPEPKRHSEFGLVEVPPMESCLVAPPAPSMVADSLYAPPSNHPSCHPLHSFLVRMTRPMLPDPLILDAKKAVEP